jgi:hypothetical protein
MTSEGDGRLVMGPVWDAAKAMGLCCGFPVEGEGDSLREEQVAVRSVVGPKKLGSTAMSYFAISRDPLAGQAWQGTQS